MRSSVAVSTLILGAALASAPSRSAKAAAARITVRGAVLRMAPYVVPEEGRAGKLRLDFNENTVGCSPSVLRALARKSQWNEGG